MSKPAADIELSIALVRDLEANDPALVGLAERTMVCLLDGP